jgi:hypothetical protein
MAWIDIAQIIKNQVVLRLSSRNIRIYIDKKTNVSAGFGS